jgi:hypothetical protein
MEPFSFLNIIDLGVIPIVMSVTQYCKTKFPNMNKRWVPVVPVITSLILSIMVILYSNGGWPGFLKFASGVLLETIKVSGASMGAFKFYHTTVKGN